MECLVSFDAEFFFFFACCLFVIGVLCCHWTSHIWSYTYSKKTTRQKKRSFGIYFGCAIDVWGDTTLYEISYSAIKIWLQFMYLYHNWAQFKHFREILWLFCCNVIFTNSHYRAFFRRQFAVFKIDRFKVDIRPFFFFFCTENEKNVHLQLIQQRVLIFHVLCM